MGILDVAWGASSDSRFYAVDDIVVRVLGALLILFSLGLLLRRNWAFMGSIAVLALFLPELLLTHNFAATSIVGMVVMVAMVLVFLGAPIALLTWLRRVVLPEKQ